MVYTKNSRRSMIFPRIWKLLSMVHQEFLPFDTSSQRSSEKGQEIHIVRGHPVSHDNQPRIETFQSAHPCSDDAIITSHNRPHIETSRSAPFCHDNGVVTSHNRLHIETFQSAGPYIPPHHGPTFASRVRLRIKIFQSAGPHTPS